MPRDFVTPQGSPYARVGEALSEAQPQTSFACRRLRQVRGTWETDMEQASTGIELVLTGMEQALTGMPVAP
ncbi:hypothetical protein Trydic_g9103 [Trypoxylus dichotomus]